MNFFGISGLIIAVTTGIISILMFTKRSKLSILWGLFVSAVSIWGIGGFFISIAKDDQIAINWWRIAYTGLIFIPVFLYHFTIYFLKLSTRFHKFSLFFIYSIGVIFLLLNFFSNLFINRVRFIFNQFYYISPPAPAYTPFVIFFLSIAFFCIIKLFITYRKSTGINKKRIGNIMFGLTIGFGGGGFNFLPVYYIDVYPYLNFLVSLGAFIVAYTILKYRFLDIRAIVFRTIAFGFILLLIASIFAVVSTFITSLFAELAGLSSNIISGLIIAILITLFYQPTRNLVEKATNTFLYKKSYNPDILLAKITEITSSTLNLKELLSSVGTILEEALNCEKNVIALLDRQKKKLRVEYKKGFLPGVAEALTAFPAVVKTMFQQFKETTGIFVVDERKTQFENGEFNPVSPKLLQVLYSADIAVIIPLYSKESLIGVLMMGNKKSGDPYGSRDLRVLNIISGQIAISIENAQLYGHLEELVDVRTEELNTANEKLGVANKQLKKLDEAKSEFLSIASHQLRTPLTAVKGYISMMNEGSFGKVPKNLDKYLSIVYVSNERLINLVNDLLNLSRIEAGKQKYDFQKTDLCSLAKEIITQLKPRSDQKGIEVHFEPPKNIPQALADQEKIHEVMLNFIDNAIKYTAKGGITIFLKSEPQGMVTFSVKDSGVGISKENIGNLFKKFSRVGSSLVHTEGTGLGLYVAKMIIEAHKGKIWAESEGENRGSTFSFSIPMYSTKLSQAIKTSS